MPLGDQQNERRPLATGRSSPREYLNNLWVVARVAFIVVTIVGLWRMGPPMRVIVVIGGLTALVIVGAVVALIVFTVRKEQGEKGIGNGTIAPPIE